MSMEPTLQTLPEDRPVLEELKRREPVFHRPEFSGSRAALAAQVAADFWEVGASGRRYSREYVLETLAERAGDPVEDRWRTSEFHCRALAPGLYLLTYTLLQGERRTRRTSIWRRSGAEWQIVFHQGTVVQE